MHKWIIIQRYKKTARGGVYFVAVLQTQSKRINRTDDIADEFGFDVVDGFMKIPHGSGTGFARIKEYLETFYQARGFDIYLVEVP